MKKIQPDRPQACSCNKDYTTTRPSPKIQAKYYIETAQVTNINEYVCIYAAKTRNSCGEIF